jgi:hypothetical protein
MEADRHGEPLDFGPQWLAGLVVQVLPVDRIWGADERVSKIEPLKFGEEEG